MSKYIEIDGVRYIPKAKNLEVHHYGYEDVETVYVLEPIPFNDYSNDDSESDE